MRDDHRLERARAWAEGRLDAAARAAFEAELAGDEQLAAFARAYRTAHQGTRDLELADLRSSLDFAALEPLLEDERRARPWRRVAAAALLLVAAGGLWAWRVHRARDVVHLEAIRLADAGPIAPARAVPAWYAEYRAVTDGAIQWLPDLDDGLRLSALTGAPLVLWGAHPTCPICKAMGESTFLDDRVQDAIADWIPVRLDVMQTSYFQDLNPVETGFPVFELRDADFEELDVRYGMVEARDFEAALEQHDPGAVPRLDLARPALSDLRAALELEAAGRLGEARAAYERLLATAPAEGYAREVRGDLARMAWQAARPRGALADADPAAALGRAAERWRGSPYARDFERVLEVWRARGRVELVQG
ncbi:MAG: hypothetical protein H6828_12920 [Planctomycetes bacterium]|nr:hypothetical protein [Planctomycetota bacterium]